MWILYYPLLPLPNSWKNQESPPHATVQPADAESVARAFGYDPLLDGISEGSCLTQQHPGSQRPLEFLIINQYYNTGLFRKAIEWTAFGLPGSTVSYPLVKYHIH